MMMMMMVVVVMIVVMMMIVVVLLDINEQLRITNWSVLPQASRPVFPR